MTKIESLQIRDQATKTNIAALVDRQIVRVLPAKRTFAAVVTGDKPAAIKFALNGNPWIERREPWVYQGDDAQIPLKPGNYTLVATAHSDPDAKTAPIAALTVVFSISAGAVVTNQCEFGLVTQMNQKPKDKDDTPAPVTVALPAIASLGVKHLRNMIWLTDWDTPPGTGAADSWKLFNAPDPVSKVRKYEITATITCAAMPRSTSQVTNAIERIVDEYGPVVSRFAVGNEPNLAKYFPGSLDEFFNAVLVPAAKVLRRRGCSVLGPAISENTVALAQLMKLGLKSVVDEACFHPYQRTGADHAKVLGIAKDIVGDMPLNATEWNIHAQNAKKWAADFPVMRQAAMQYLRRAFFYRSTVRADRPAGKWALFDTSWRPNGPMYQLFLETR